MKQQIKNLGKSIQRLSNLCTNCGNEIKKYGLLIPTLNEKSRQLCMKCADKNYLAKLVITHKLMPKKPTSISEYTRGVEDTLNRIEDWKENWAEDIGNEAYDELEDILQVKGKWRGDSRGTC